MTTTTADWNPLRTEGAQAYRLWFVGLSLKAWTGNPNLCPDGKRDGGKAMNETQGTKPSRKPRGPSKRKDLKLPQGVRQDAEGNFYLDYYAGGRRVREWIGPNKRLAVTVMAKRRTEIAEDRYLDKKTVRRVTFRQYGEEYRKVYSARKKSAKRDATSLKALLPVFGDLFLDGVTPEMVHRYQSDRLDQGKKPATVNRELALLKTIFNRAIESGKASGNPVVKVKFLKENNARCRILEPEERERLREEMHLRIRRIYDFARKTGFRQGEIFRLKWPDADLKGGFLRVGEAKSGEGRTIPLNRTARAILESIPYRLDGG